MIRYSKKDFVVQQMIARKPLLLGILYSKWAATQRKDPRLQTSFNDYMEEFLDAMAARRVSGDNSTQWRSFSVVYDLGKCYVDIWDVAVDFCVECGFDPKHTYSAEKR